MSNYAVIKLNNTFARGAYSMPLRMGNADTPQVLNLVIDTGSSTFVVDGQKLKCLDKTLSSTHLVQQLRYGLGAWIGPIAKASIELGHCQHTLALCDAHLSVTFSADKGTFASADGMVGFAYSDLNIGHDVSAYYRQNTISDPISWFASQCHVTPSLDLNDYPVQAMASLIDEFVEHHSCDNVFSLIVHRSSIYQHGKCAHEGVTHPINTGMLVLGHPKHYQHLHKNNFKSIDVVKDKYYNVEVTGIKIESSGNTDDPSQKNLIEKQRSPSTGNRVSNAIIDSGATYIVLNESLYHGLIEQLTQYNNGFADVLSKFAHISTKEVGVDISTVDLAKWPNINFTLKSSSGENINVTMPPHAYWQIHAPIEGQISFKIAMVANMPSDIILGLPFLTNHLTVFARDMDERGEILIADKTFAPHTITASQQHDVSFLQNQFTRHQHAL